MIDLKYYDFNKFINKARLNTYGLDTLENIFQNIGAGPPVLLDGTIKQPPPDPEGIVEALPAPVVSGRSSSDRE